MQDCKVQLFADFARAFQAAVIHIVPSATFPTPLSLCDPRDNLTGAQFLEFLTCVEVVVLVVTVRTVGGRFRRSSLLFYCEENWTWPLL